jgi:hypothetical protein
LFRQITLLSVLAFAFWCASFSRERGEVIGNVATKATEIAFSQLSAMS